MPDTHGALILIHGLAGTGKSHLIEMLRYDFLIQENFASTDNCEDRNIQDVARELRCGRRCTISERKYRSSVQRSKLIQRVLTNVSPSPPPLIRVICFENDLEAANYKCLNKTNKDQYLTGEDHVAQNNEDTLDYEIHSNAIVVKIHQIA